VIPNSTQDDEWGMGKMGVLHFGGNNLRNCVVYTLDQYRALVMKFDKLNGIIFGRL